MQGKHKPTGRMTAPRGYAGGGAMQLLAGDRPIRNEYDEKNKMEAPAHTTGAPKRMKGKVRGPKGKDKVPAWLTPDEYVLPKETVDAMGGAGALDRLVEATTGKKPGGKPVERDNSVFGFNQGGAPKPSMKSRAIERLREIGAARKAHLEQPVTPMPAHHAPVGNGMAGGAVKTLMSRREQLEAAERKALGYAAGGSPSVGRMVKGYAAGGSVDEILRRQMRQANAGQEQLRGSAARPAASGSVDLTRGMTASTPPAQPTAQPSASPAASPAAAASPKPPGAIKRAMNFGGKVIKRGVIPAVIAGDAINSGRGGGAIQFSPTDERINSTSGRVDSALRAGALNVGDAATGVFDTAIGGLANVVLPKDKQIPSMQQGYRRMVTGYFGPGGGGEGLGAADIRQEPPEAPIATPQAEAPRASTVTPAANESAALDEMLAPVSPAPASTAADQQSENAAYNRLRGSMGDAISRNMTPGREGVTERGNAGLRALATDEGLREQMNAQYQRDNIGVQASTDANGRMVFSDAPIDPERPTTRRGVSSVGDLAAANRSFEQANAIRRGDRPASAEERLTAFDRETAAQEARRRSSQYGLVFRDRAREEQRNQMTGAMNRMAELQMAQPAQDIHNEAARIGLERERRTSDLEARALSGDQEAVKLLSAIRGRAEREGRPQTFQDEELINPADPLQGVRKVTYILDPDGSVRRAVSQGGEYVETMADVEATAKEHGMKVEDVVNMLRAQGIEVR